MNSLNIRYLILIGKVTNKVGLWITLIFLDVVIENVLEKVKDNYDKII
tara:strand:+ start:973 stop:1116 length:144 start_codon:yes stop_codon:yes gene_type:complete